MSASVGVSSKWRLTGLSIVAVTAERRAYQTWKLR
jgi:hypothetical protein